MTMASAESSSSSSPGKWLWPATPMEEFSEVGHQRGTFLICYQISLVSDTPLLPDQVRETLHHLRRKVPCLRICYGRHEGVVWIREATTTNIDFQVVTDEDFWEVMNCLRSYRYQSETGPLWCARLLPDNQEKSRKKETYQFMFGFHHGIIDGFTAMKICGFFVTLLNDVISGNAISDAQLGDYVGHEATNKLIQERKILLEGNDALREKLIHAAESRKDIRSIFRKSFNSAENGKVRTRSVIHKMEPEPTSRFIKKCRYEGVTVHSAFTALANIAMVDLVLENGVKQDSYCFINQHVINIRRYWSGDVSRSLGCHIVAPMRIYTDIQKDQRADTFWELARSVHKDLQESLKEGVILQNQAVSQLTSSAKCDEKDFFYPPVPADFSTSNLGDVTQMVTEGGDHVQPTCVLRSVSIHHTNASWSHLFNSYKGRFIHVLDYNNATITKDMAEKYSHSIFKHLREVL